MYSISQEIWTRFLLCCALLWLYNDWFFPYPPGLLDWHCGNLTIAPVPAKQPWWIWINISCELIMNDCITTTKQRTTKPCAYFLGYTVRTRANGVHCGNSRGRVDTNETGMWKVMWCFLYTIYPLALWKYGSNFIYHLNLWELALKLVSTGSGIGLVLSGNKTLPEPTLNPIYVALCVKAKHVHDHVMVCVCIMMTSSNGNIFRVTGPLCGEFTGPGEFPTQRPVTRSFDVFFDLRLNKRLNKQPWGWWFETLSWSLWRHCNDGYISNSLWTAMNNVLILFKVVTWTKI